MSAWLENSFAIFRARLGDPPTIPIQHGPSDLRALADHAAEVTHQYIEYMRSIAREAHGCNVEINPENVANELHDAFHDTDLCQSIRDEAENMVERAMEDA